MAFVLADRVQETSTTTGTGTLTLAGAVTGFQSFSAIGNGNTTYYAISDGTNWEVGIGTYTSAGTTLSRTTVLASSNAGSLVSFPAGTKSVFCDYPAGKSVYLDSSGNASSLGTPAAFTATNVTGLPLTTGVTGTLPIANGGNNSTATPTAGSVHYGTGTAWAATSAGTSGNALISAGAGAPAFGNLAIGTANTNVSGALTPTNGGTGVSTLTGLAYGNGTSAFTAATAAQVVSVIGSTAVTNATNATTATNATNVATTGGSSSASTFYPTFVASNTSSNQAETTTANLNFVPSTGVLSSSILSASNGIVVNNRTIATSYSIPSGYSATSAGPVTLNSGVSVTVPTGGKWVVL